MDSYRPPQMPLVNNAPDVGEALNEASAFLRRLIPFPGSDVLTPLSPLSLPVLSGTTQANPVDAAADVVKEQASSIVSHVFFRHSSARASARSGSPDLLVDDHARDAHRHMA